MRQPRIAITCSSTEKIADAKQLADLLHLPFINDPNNAFIVGPHYDRLLVLTPNYLGLMDKNSKKPFYIDFLAGKLRHRSSQAGRRKEPLARAISLSPRDHPIIIDATAGLGRDSFILATLGYNVIMLERSTPLYALLLDALKRAEKDKPLASVIKRLHLIHTDALSWLSGVFLRETATIGAALPLSRPSIIYLDPMFPERKKSASVKKEMVILQDLLGIDNNPDELFELALACAIHRVVVKRPRLAANITTQHKPTYSIIGKSSRFDVYLVPKV